MGPLLFLIFINDLEDNTSGNVLKFADDTKIVRQVRDVQDNISMQADLDQLVEWADKWQMQFNVSQVQGYACRPEKSKCEVSRVRAMLLMSVVYIFFCLLLGLLFCRSRYILRRPCRHCRRCRPVISAADVGMAGAVGGRIH